jgi:hypothetical protein
MTKYCMFYVFLIQEYLLEKKNYCGCNMCFLCDHIKQWLEIFLGLYIKVLYEIQIVTFQLKMTNCMLDVLQSILQPAASNDEAEVLCMN